MTETARRPATAADVAARAGVSRATVSHIFTGREGNFAPETRERVLRAARELDYRPSPAGRNLVRGRGDTIVLLAPMSTIGQNHQDAMERLAVDTAGIGANVVLRFADPDQDATATAILRLRPLAVVDLAGLAPAARERLAAQGVPTVPRLDDALARHELPVEDQIATMQLVELTRGHPRQLIYASLIDRRPDPYSAGRLAAIQAECTRRALPPALSVALPLDKDGALQALGPLLGSRPTGVAAYNDAVALAALSVGRRLGKSVPDDFAVVGMDNTPFAHLAEPQLTTIDVNMDHLMDVAVTQLAKKLGIRLELPPHSRSALLTLVRGDSS